MAETLAEKQARAKKLTSSQRQAILKNFKLTSAQQQSLRTMSADAADRQIQRWQDEYVVNNLPAPKTPGPGKTPTPATTETAVPPDWEQAAMDLYGGYYAIVQSVPELKELLLQAVTNKWDKAKFEYALRQTQWWKNTSNSARQWDMASQLDPASAQQELDNRVLELRNLAMNQFGVNLNQDSLTRIARDSLRGGWGNDLISNAIGLEATKTESGMSQLATGYIGQTVRQTANNYGLKLSQDSLNNWVSGIATGQATQQSFQQYALETAKSLFPAISSQLDAGSTFQDIVDPFRNVAAQILEINPEFIDFTEPKWAAAITNPDKSGMQRMMTYSEWGDYLRKTPSFGYEYTSSAQERAFDVANRLASLFGRA